MSRFIFIIVSCFLAFFLIACSQEEPSGVLSESQKKALDGAKEVEDILKDADEKRRELLEE